MSPERAKELLPVIQAFAKGKAIQAKNKCGAECEWQDCGDAGWIESIDYRIKPEPREWWIGENEGEVDTAYRCDVGNTIHVREVLE